MKKAHNRNGYGILFLLVSIMFFLLLINGLVTGVRYAVQGAWDNVLATAIGCVIFSLILGFFLFAANRILCTVWLEDKTIKRKGLFWGFYKELNVCDIQDVVLFRPHKEGMHICLIDTSKCKFDSVRNDSYICFPKTESNMQFLRLFWNDEITEVTGS